MKTYDVQSIQLSVDARRAFDYIADADRLPEWTNAFASVDGPSATMRTPAGETRIELRVHADPPTGVIDWEMRFADGSVEHACSRLVPAGDGSCIYSFVLQPPAGLLEQLEGGLESQSGILAEELKRLKLLLENGPRN